MGQRLGALVSVVNDSGSLSSSIYGPQLSITQF